MSRWTLEEVQGGPDGFPFAIANKDGQVIAWVKEKRDAAFMARAPENIAHLIGEVKTILGRVKAAHDFLEDELERHHSGEKE